MPARTETCLSLPPRWGISKYMKARGMTKSSDSPAGMMAPRIKPRKMPATHTTKTASEEPNKNTGIDRLPGLVSSSVMVTTKDWSDRKKAARRRSMNDLSSRTRRSERLYIEYLRFTTMAVSRTITAEAPAP